MHPYYWLLIYFSANNTFDFHSFSFLHFNQQSNKTTFVPHFFSIFSSYIFQLIQDVSAIPIPSLNLNLYCSTIYRIKWICQTLSDFKSWVKIQLLSHLTKLKLRRKTPQHISKKWKYLPLTNLRKSAEILANQINSLFGGKQLGTLAKEIFNVANWRRNKSEDQDLVSDERPKQR